ncbi:hypothetical protein FQA39_LY12128 [Lamprigera yunnana]|nr:hypothetical protein FQA39_LY12128 [Lamprigera yunnana]
MDTGLKETRGTAQESSEAPVPARGESSAAGRSGRHPTTTRIGEEEELDPFSRRSSFLRTPTGQTKKIKKRKANTSPLIARQVVITEPNLDMVKLKKKIEDLVKYSNNNRNVHLEVKKMANELNLLINGAVISERRRNAEIVSQQVERQEEEPSGSEEKKDATILTYEKEEKIGMERINDA